MLPERDNHVIWVLFARNTKPNAANQASQDESLENERVSMGGSRESVSTMKVNKAPPFAPTPLPPIEIVGMQGKDVSIEESITLSHIHVSSNVYFFLSSLYRRCGP